MAEKESKRSIGTLSFEKSTHAPVYKQYREGEFVDVGDNPKGGNPWRIDPKTGAEIHALGGLDHKYSTSLEVGPSYPPTVFVFGKKADGGPVGHDTLKTFLKQHELWSGNLHPVAVAQDNTGGPHFSYGFQFRPPETAPSSLNRAQTVIKDEFGLDDHEIIDSPAGFQAFVG